MDNKIIESALLFAEQRKSIYTGCIHYKNDKEETRDVIPLYENVLYGISLVASLSKEKAEKGLAFLMRLCSFFTKDGFVAYVHDFPQVYQDKNNVDICLALTYFLKCYGKVIPQAYRDKIEGFQKKLLSIVKKRPLKKWDLFVLDAIVGKKGTMRAESLPEMERYILCSLLLREKVELPWHKSLGVYIGPLSETYYKGYSPMPSLISQLAKGGEVHRSALLATLLAREPLFDLIIYPTFEREDLFVHRDKNLLSVHFAKHSLVAKGDIEVVVDNDHLDVFVGEFEEMEFFFTDFLESKVFVGSEKATAFYPDDEITLWTPEKKITCRFISTTPFMGHIMKGNRDNQLEDCNKNFALFDHKVLLKQTSQK